MKSAQKIFDVLEYVILQNGDRVTPTDVSAALDLNPATVTRILQVLKGRGYLLQVSRKGGYIPGPMVTSIGTRRNIFTRLAVAAESPLRELSEMLRCQVNIAVMNGTRRIMLRFHAPDFGFTPWERFSFEDHWSTATGRLLIAALPDEDARKVCASCEIQPYPTKEIVKIREQGFVRFSQDELTIIGHLVSVPGYPPAAFGFGIPRIKADEAFFCSAKTAKRIVQNLSVKNQAY